MEHVSKTAEEIKANLRELADSRQSPTRQSSAECQACSDTGFLRIENAVTRCQCQREKIVKAKLDAIPKRFAGARLTNYVPMDSRQQSALDIVARDFTKSFFMHGNYGRGKTHLAVAQYVELVKIERPCCFISIHDLVAELRKSEMDSDYFCTIRQRVRHAEQFHVLIDDIDKFKPSDFRFEALFDFFNKIYARKLGLTITSNYNMAQLAEANLLDGAILRRIDDICEPVEV